jgi:hypothetical protein
MSTEPTTARTGDPPTAATAATTPTQTARHPPCTTPTSTATLASFKDLHDDDALALVPAPAAGAGTRTKTGADPQARLFKPTANTDEKRELCGAKDWEQRQQKRHDSVNTKRAAAHQQDFQSLCMSPPLVPLPEDDKDDDFGCLKDQLKAERMENI